MNSHNLFTFQENVNMEEYNEGNSEPHIVGGVSVKKILLNTPDEFNKNRTDEFQRYKHLVIPIGLHVGCNTTDNDMYAHDNVYYEDEYETKIVEPKLFETIFYSVSKDLGNTKSTKSKNKITKKSRKN